MIKRNKIKKQLEELETREQQQTTRSVFLYALRNFQIFMSRTIRR